jgi:hypothetical protein
MKFHFFKRKECTVPTAATWCAASILCVVVLAACALTVHSFLAPVNTVPSDILVVEGWMPEYALQRVAADFKTKGYRLMIVTGGPVENGSFLSGYNTLAEVGFRTLVKLGVDSTRVVAAPSQFVRKDRTYEEAVALKQWLERSGTSGCSLNLYSLGCHARRSHFLYTYVLGKAYALGIVACADQSYDSRRWWRYSNGVRAIADESLAYAYAVAFSLFASDLRN